MEAIIFVAILAVILFFAFFIIVGLSPVLSPVILKVYKLSPFIVGIGGGILLVAMGHRITGTFFSAFGILIGILWQRHLVKKRHGCRCLFHRIYRKLR